MAARILSARRREKLLSTVWGGFWGVVVGGAIITVGSQLAVRHDLLLPKPEAKAVETPSGTEFDQARPETDPEVPSEETVPAADIAAATPGQPGPADASPVLDTSSAEAPSAGGDGPAALERPEVPRGADVALTNREGLRPETGAAPEATAPLPPGTERPIAVARDVPAPPASEDAPQVAVADPQTTAPQLPTTVDDLAEVEPDPAPVAVETLQPEVADVAPAQPLGEQEANPVAEAEPAEVPTLAEVDPASPTIPEPEAEPAAPRQVADAQPETAAPAAPVAETLETAPEVLATPASTVTDPETDDAPALEVASATESAPELETPAPAVSGAPDTQPVAPASPVSKNVAVETTEPRRIETEGASQIETAEAQEPPSPSVGQPAIRRVGETETEPTPEVEAETETAEAATQSGGGALAANRNDFVADPDLAQMSVVLLHEGDVVPDTAALDALPKEVSFAVSGAGPSAADIAGAYRASGREVVLIPSFPPGATPQDVEVALGANLEAVNSAVAVMDPGSAGFQGDRAAVGQVVAVLAETGHALITASRGLNTAQQIAGRFDVPAATIFSDLGDGSDAGAIGRALDRVAFRARQESGIIILGRADVATAEGVANWVTGRAAEGLQLAPISAVLAPEEASGTSTEDVATDAEGSGPTIRRLPQIQVAPNSN